MLICLAGTTDLLVDAASAAIEIAVSSSEMAKLVRASVDRIGKGRNWATGARMSVEWLDGAKAGALRPPNICGN